MPKDEPGQAALFDRDGRPVGPGPVYQGVCKQIRAMIADETIGRDSHAGLIASTRQLAGSIDRASGHGDRKPEYGQSLAALHAQLSAQLAELRGIAPTARDPFQEFLEDLAQPDTAPADG